MIDDGWILRSDIIWSKSNSLPESVRDRPTASHEYLFLFSKSNKHMLWRHRDTGAWTRERPDPDYRYATRGENRAEYESEPDGIETFRVNLWKGYSYYYDADAIAEPYADSTLKEIAQGYDGEGIKDYESPGIQNPSDVKRRIIEGARKPKRWPGIGPQHGKERNRGEEYSPMQVNDKRNKRSVWRLPTAQFKGAHFATFPVGLVEPAVLAGSAEGDAVLDPFSGSGTTGVVALRHNRRFVGIDISEKYAQMARDKIRGDAPLFNIG